MKKSLVALLIPLVVAACGGGGDTVAPVASKTVPESLPEGAYAGTTTTGSGSNFISIVLENKDSWMLYGNEVGGTLYVTGMVSGISGTSNGSTYTATVSDYNDSWQVFSGSLSASYVAGQSMGGTISTTRGTSTFSGTAIPADQYDYQQAASLSVLSGSWSGGSLGGDSGTLVIAGDGSATASFNSGCTATAQFTPRASGKNVFDFSITFGASPCVAPGVTAAGNAFIYAIQGSGLSRLVMVGTTPDRSAGSVFLAQR